MKLIGELFARFFWWLANRPLLKVRIIEDHPDKPEGGLVFEVENVSPTATSLSPIVISSFLYPKGGVFHKGQAIFDVRELDRNLPPYTPKMFSASARELPSGYGYSWFPIYCFCPRTGRQTKVRVRDVVLLEPVGLVTFWLERCRFRITGKVKKDDCMTLSKYEAMRRSRGPR